MGWRFSRSINLGPLRINLSKRGVGASVGAGPFRIGRSASGRNYGSARIPGTGISYRTESRERGRSIGIGCLAAAAVLALVAVVAAAFLFLRSGA
jgi:hypothetical protein